MTKLEQQAISWRPHSDCNGGLVVTVCLWGKPDIRCILIEDEPGIWVEITANGARGTIRGNLFEATCAVLAKRIDWFREYQEFREQAETLSKELATV